MLGRIAVLAASIALASCAGLEPVGRNSGRDPAPPPAPSASRQTPAPVASRPAPQPQQQAVAPTPAPALTIPPQAAPRATTPAPIAAPTPAPQTAPSVAAPAVTVPTPAPQRTTSAAADDDIVVPGQREQQVRPPAGDPRSTAQRMEDVRAWDQCVTRAQAAFESDPMRPQLTTPEDYCGQSLGMTSRLAVPESRRQRQR